MLPRMGTTTEDASAHSWSSTRAWLEKTLSAGERVERVERLRGGWTSEMRRLDVTGPDGPAPWSCAPSSRPSSCGTPRAC